jgi:gliding motility-associated-like protein
MWNRCRGSAVVLYEISNIIDLTECVNLFDLTENTATILGTLDPNDYEIAYFLNQTDAENFANEISNPTTFVSTSNPQTIYAGISGFVTGCVIVKEFEISVISCTLDPQPNPLSSCDDNPVDGFTLFDLTQSDTAALNGLDPTLYTVTYHNSQADANTGNAPITPATAYNGFNGEIVYVRVEENAAPTTFGTTSFALTINPTPSIADVVQTICSGDTFTVTPTNTAPDVVPTGTTYTWTVAAPAGITGASNQATAQTSISQTLTNTTSTSLSAIYTVTASVGTAPNICTDTFTITVTVNPKPSIADVTQAICTGNTFTVTPTNTAPDVVPTGTTYTWTVTAPAGITGASNQATAQTSISQTLTNATSNSIVVTYTVTASFGTAPNVCTDTFTIAVTVNPEPSIADVVQTICSGDTFTVTPTNTAPDVVPTGTTYTWTVAAPAGITGASNQTTAQTSISQTLTNTTSTSLSAIYTVTASVGTAPNICTDTFTITVTVNPKPSIADVTQAICTGNTFTVTPTNTAPDIVPTGTTYTWTVTTPAGITGASNQATAQTSISQTLSNSTSNSIVVTYTVTASFGTAPNVCTDTFTIAVTVNPEPSIADVVQTICSGDTFTVTPTNTAPNVVPTGTTYTWTVTAPAGITGASNQATAQTSISQTLTNTTLGSLSAIYTVTASAGTAPTICTDTFTITVTVNPNPSIADVTQTICSGDTFTVTPTNTAPDVVPTGTTYTWTVTTPAGITGASNQATAQTSISQTLNNTTSSSINVVYTVTASFGTAPTVCTDTFIITVTVNPNPSIANKTQTICSGTTFTVTPSNTAPDVVPTGTTYTWSVAAPAGITGASNQATAQTSISQTLTNTTSTSLSAVYTVTATFGTAPNSCSSSFNITVTVIPNPNITDVTQTICSTGTFTVTPTNTAPDVVPTGTTYTWTVIAPAGITGASNQGTAQTSISQTLTNTTSSAINVVYTVTASVGTAPTVCTDTFTITVTVNPKPSIANKTQTICSGTTFSVTPTDTAPDVVPTGTTYTWTVTAPAGISGASNQATAQTAISQTLSNTTNAAISAVYTVTAFSGVVPNVCTNTFIVTVTVNPNPVIANKTQTICSTGTFTVTPTNTAPDVVPTGTTYTWTVTAGAGITGASNQATAQTSISQTLTNTTSAPINVIYAVTASSGTAPNSCTGTFIITVTVNPKPSIANKTQAICSTETFTVSPIDGVDVVPIGTTYTWTVTAPAGITGASNQATGQVNISQALTNTTTAPLNVIYTVTASFGLAPNVCTSTFIVTVTVNPLPTASIAGTITICPSTEATITFTGTANATVEYTVNGGGVQTLDLDASGFGSITETFTITTTYLLVGVFSNSTPICSVPLNQSVTVNVLPAPLINMPADLVNCDDNNDGISIFDLTQTIAFITGGNPNVTVTFHETADDALLGGAPIQTPSNYTSIDPNFQTIYVRVVNTGTTDCPSVTSFNLIVNPYPVINLTPDDYALCDLNSDTQEEFDLTTTIPNILGTLNPALHTVTFYETQAEAEAGTPQITGVTTYTTVTHTVWVRVTINATGCYSVVPLELIVNPLPIANIPTPLSLCDVNNSGDQQETFDMTLAIPDIVGTQVGMQVTFHLTLAQAQAGTNALPTTYTNTSNVQPIHVRVFDPVTGCFSTTILDLRVEPLPQLFPIGPTVLCDDNNDGIASFDLAALVSTLLNGASPSDITVTFHETEQQAQDGSDVIDTTVLYQTIDAGQQTLYVRAQDNATGCVSVRAIVLVVNPRPEMPTLPNLTQCDTDSNTQNGLSTFNLSVQTPVILAAQSGAASGYQVRYFTTEQNAIDNVSWIATPNSYPSTSNPQIIWVRVTHLTSGCYRTGSFELIVNIPLALTFPTPLSLCDEGLPNNQFTVFDLTVRTNEITQGLGGYTVAYYPSYQNALDDVNVIQNPQAYTNTTAAVQTLGVRVTSAEGCHSYTTLTIRVLPLPEPLTDPLAIEACDDNNPGDGIETFDLTLRAVYILNGASQTEFALTYYETEADANAGTNAIADPTNYTSTTANTQTIWVRVTRIPGVNEPSCYQLVQLQLIVNPLPVIAESPIAFYQCEPIDDYTMAFVLSTMNPRVLGSTQSASDYTVSYYLTAADALAGTPQLPNVYTNISSPQTIYVRVENNLTGCVNATGEVILEVEEGTQANMIPVNAPETTQCDTIGDNDGIYTFDLSGGVTPILIGTNNPTGTVVYYYESLSAAQLATTSNDYSGAIATPSAYNNTMPQHQTLYAVLVNPATNSNCPTITPVELTVFLLPEPTPEGGTICLDPETGALLNDYTLESNLNPLTHTFVWTNAAGTVMGTGASLTVTDPDVYTVVATHTATGCVSEAVTAAVVHSQQATLTYVVSNYFTDNQTITVIATGTTIPNQNNDNYLYSIDYGPFQVSNVFTNVGFGWHDITVQDTNGCLDATIRAFVINYPRFFTPNGDQQNDTWNIFSLREVNPNAKIYIFDRYGKFIKQISPMGVGWDGTFNGEALPSTDYWFTVEYEEQGEAKVFKAHFSLKR